MSPLAYADCYGKGSGCVPDAALNAYLIIVCGGGAAIAIYIWLRRWALRRLMQRATFHGSEWTYESEQAPPLNIDKWRVPFWIAFGLGLGALVVSSLHGDWYLGLALLLGFLGLAIAAPWLYRDRWIWRQFLLRR